MREISAMRCVFAGRRTPPRVSRRAILESHRAAGCADDIAVAVRRAPGTNQCGNSQIVIRQLHHAATYRSMKSPSQARLGPPPNQESDSVSSTTERTAEAVALFACS
jgi:hypothetical protein